jgi:hypothetical protein
MNLSALAGPLVAIVNPWVTAQYLPSTGVYITTADGQRTPTPPTPSDMQVQMQALTFGDLQQISGLNIQGEKRALYCQGDIKGVARPDGKGGDLFTMPDSSRWLVVLVLENWFTTAGWTKVAVVKQKVAATP